MPTTPPSIAALPAAPDPNDRSTFNARAYPWSVAQQTFATEVAAVAANVKANADEAEADALAAEADRIATAADRVQTGLDATATAADRVQTGLDAAATAADRVQTGLDATATAEDRVAVNSALASIAGGPVASVNGMTGVVTGIATTEDLTAERSAAATLTNKTLTDPKLTLGGTNGASGQVPVSQGAGQPPTWATLALDPVYQWEPFPPINAAFQSGGGSFCAVQNEHGFLVFKSLSNSSGYVAPVNYAFNHRLQWYVGINDFSPYGLTGTYFAVSRKSKFNSSPFVILGRLSSSYSNLMFLSSTGSVAGTNYSDSTPTYSHGNNIHVVSDAVLTWTRSKDNDRLYLRTATYSGTAITFANDYTLFSNAMMVGDNFGWASDVSAAGKTNVLAICKTTGSGYTAGRLYSICTDGGGATGAVGTEVRANVQKVFNCNITTGGTGQVAAVYESSGSVYSRLIKDSGAGGSAGQTFSTEIALGSGAIPSVAQINNESYVVCFFDNVNFKFVAKKISISAGEISVASTVDVLILPSIDPGFSKTVCAYSGGYLFVSAMSSTTHVSKTIQFS